MAGEQTYTGNTDLFIAAALNQQIHANLVDNTDLKGKCVNYGSVSGSGSTASQIGKVSWDDAMGAANTDEVTAVSATDLGHGAATITVARQSLRRDISDLYALVGGPAPRIDEYAAQMANAAVLRFTDMVTSLFSALTQGGGTSTVALSVDDISDGQYALIQAGAPGGLTFVGSPKQITDFLDSLRGEGGSSEFQAETWNMLSAGGAEYQGYGRMGVWRGIEFWSCDSVATSGSDKVGAIFAPGAFGYMEGIPSAMHSAPGSYAGLAPNGSPIFVEFERDASKGHTIVVGNYFVGVSTIEAARARKIISSAT